jgi:hypothetical protein
LNSLPLLEQESRGPALVLVLRDALAVAARECIAMGTELTAAMQQSIVRQTRMVDFAAASSSPCLLVSYEKALQFPDLVAAALAGWAGLQASAEQCRQAAAHVVANQESYLRGVRNQCDLSGVPQPGRITTFAAGAPFGASADVTREPRDSAAFDVLRAELDGVRKEYAITIRAVESERDRLLSEIAAIVGSPGWKAITGYRQWFARSMARRSWFVRASEPLARWYLRRVDNRRPQ